MLCHRIPGWTSVANSASARPNIRSSVPREHGFDLSFTAAMTQALPTAAPFGSGFPIASGEPLLNNLDHLHHALIFMIQNMTVDDELTDKVFISTANRYWTIRLKHQQSVTPNRLIVAIGIWPSDLERIYMDVKRVVFVGRT